jgi:hypothetical protein
MSTEDKNLHDVQYMTCDHNCVMMTGLMSDKIKSVWRDVRKEVRSSDDGSGCDVESWKIADMEVPDAWPLARLTVCRKEEKPREVEDEIVAWLPVGEIGRCGAGLGGVAKKGPF